MPRVQQKRGTASALASVNPMPAAGELVWDSTENAIKIGDGSTAWNSLAYVTATPRTHTHTLSQISDISIPSPLTENAIIRYTAGVGWSAATGVGIVGVGSQPLGGWPAGSVGAALAGKAASDDARFTDTRTPTDGSVTTAKIADSNVTYAKIQNVSATDRLLGRSSAGAGVVQEITCTAFGRSLIDDADAAAARGTLGVPALTGSNFTGQVSFTRNPSDTSLSQAIFVDCDYATTSSSQRFNFGINIDARKVVSAGVADTGYILGLSIDAYHEGDGDLTQAIAYRCSTGKRVASTGTVAQAYGVWSRVLNLGTGAITDGYGVYISDVQATNGWGVYQEAANDNNYFRGNVGIGASRTTPGTALDVNGVITVAATGGSAGTYLPSVCISGDSNTGFGQVSGQSDSASVFTAGHERVRVDASGRLGIATTSPTATLDVNADTMRLRTARTPASASAAGAAGDICWDADYVYVCTATNVWKRAALSTW